MHGVRVAFSVLRSTLVAVLAGGLCAWGYWKWHGDVPSGWGAEFGMFAAAAGLSRRRISL